jgi:hypothetical protein
MKLLKNAALAAAVALSVGFIGACSDEVPASTTTTTEYSTTVPAIYVAPPVTTSSATTTTQYPKGTVTSITPLYSNVVTRPSVVMVPTTAPVLVQASPPVVQIAPVVMTPIPSQTTTSSSWGNGVTEQKRTTTSVDGSVQNQTTSWYGD